MKSFWIVALLVPAGAVQAPTRPDATPAPLSRNLPGGSIPFGQVLTPRGLGKWADTSRQLQNFLVQNPQARLIDSTRLGMVYALPQDGMPCIVPVETPSMPNP
ncbi:MAG TPA: hypothetical protein VHK69_03525, partial [Chitinophagaceae bacterium]|nr:hypothetical protein [Chitinophagaceae bacterium]